MSSVLGWIRSELLSWVEMDTPIALDSAKKILLSLPNKGLDELTVTQKGDMIVIRSRARKPWDVSLRLESRLSALSVNGGVRLRGKIRLGESKDRGLLYIALIGYAVMAYIVLTDLFDGGVLSVDLQRYSVVFLGFSGVLVLGRLAEYVQIIVAYKKRERLKHTVQTALFPSDINPRKHNGR
jgi:hypothetical protein